MSWKIGISKHGSPSHILRLASLLVSGYSQMVEYCVELFRTVCQVPKLFLCGEQELFRSKGRFLKLEQNGPVPCAVGEFDLDDPNPFGWDLANFVETGPFPFEKHSMLPNEKMTGGVTMWPQGELYELPMNEVFDVNYSLDDEMADFSSKRKFENQVFHEPQFDHPIIMLETQEKPLKKPRRCSSIGEQAFACSYCSASFKVKGYLTRHLKKHSISKAFTCPFFQDIDLHLAEGKPIKGTKCHPTGGFSRRDTFKTHLKALHFIYPPGTKSSERNHVSGRCAGCFRFFENNNSWLETHIEPNRCSGTVLC